MICTHCVSWRRKEHSKIDPARKYSFQKFLEQLGLGTKDVPRGLIHRTGFARTLANCSELLWDVEDDLIHN